MNTCRPTPAFAAVSGLPVRASTGALASSFVCTTRRARVAAPSPTPRWTMGKQARFGPFSPIVILSSWILGSKRLNKIRGKAIALHSQTITAFCEYSGTGPSMRTALIKQAKTNGDKLGFLS